MVEKKAKWMRTNSGHAGRSGFIVKCQPGEATKYKFTTYDGTWTNFSDSVGDLKRDADALMTTITAEEVELG
jgi:hypothetical protein